MSNIELSPEQLYSVIYDDDRNVLYPECYLMNGSQVLATVKLFGTSCGVSYGFEEPESDTRKHWIVYNIVMENNKLFSDSYQRI
jgi:hypothetical protein